MLVGAIPALALGRALWFILAQKYIPFYWSCLFSSDKQQPKVGGRGQVALGLAGWAAQFVVCRTRTRLDGQVEGLTTHPMLVLRADGQRQNKWELGSGAARRGDTGLGTIRRWLEIDGANLAGSCDGIPRDWRRSPCY